MLRKSAPELFWPGDLGPEQQHGAEDHGDAAGFLENDGHNGRQVSKHRQCQTDNVIDDGKKNIELDSPQHLPGHLHEFDQP